MYNEGLKGAQILCQLKCADGVDQRDYLEGTSDKSARDTFFYYKGATPSAVRPANRTQGGTRDSSYLPNP